MNKTSIEKLLKKEGQLIYTINGFSMLPLLRENKDAVLLKASENYEVNDVILFKASKNSYILHRIVKIENNKYYVIGDNSTKVDILSREDILAKMEAYYKDDKMIETSSKEYKKYLENYVVPLKNHFTELLTNRTEYLNNRFKLAYYELLKLGLGLKVNKDVILNLRNDEFTRLCNFSYYRKAYHLLASLIKDENTERFSPSLVKKLLSDLDLSKLRFMRLEQAQNAISEVFERNKIKHIYLKGAELRSNYKTPYFRVSNDIDLYVFEDQFELAKEVLVKELNGRLGHNNPYHQSIEFDQFVLHLELHHIINYDLPKDKQYLLSNPLDNAYEDKKISSRYHLNKEYYYLYHIVHIAKHFKGSDFWMTMLMDTYLLNKDKLDKNLIKDVGLDLFESSLINIIDKGINDGVLSPLDSKLEKICFVNNEENYYFFQKAKNKNAFVFLWNRIFVSRSVLKGMYPSLAKHVLLVPLCEVLRWFRVLKPSKFKKSVQEVNHYNDFEVNSRKIMIEVGLKDFIE